MVNLVWDLKNEIEMKDIVNFGKILHENWNLKKTLILKLAIIRLIVYIMIVWTQEL